MKIKRFLANNIRDAMRQVRAAQGPDAVILSNTKVNGGVEIVAAVDYDEGLVHELIPKSGARETSTAAVDRKPGKPSNHASRSTDTSVWSQEPTLAAMQAELQGLRDLMHNQLTGLAWGETTRKNPLRTRLLRMLLESGFSPRLCMETANQLPSGKDFAWIRRMALGLLARRLTVTGVEAASLKGVVVLVGPTGVGKTTTIAKLAAQHTLSGGTRKAGMITCDNYRIGAHEQLRTYAKLLDIPCHVANSGRQLVSAMAALRNCSLILIDTIGTSQKLTHRRDLNALLSALPGDVIKYLVMSAAGDYMVLDEIAGAYNRIGVSGCVLTKLDEAASLGGALSVLIHRDIPVTYQCEGQRVPEDLRPAQPHSLISRNVALNRNHDEFIQSIDGESTDSKFSLDLVQRVAMASTFSGGR